MLIGFFVGDAVEPFDHAATTGYRWTVRALSRELESVGFEVIETHTRTGSGYRPHGAITALRQSLR